MQKKELTGKQYGWLAVDHYIGSKEIGKSHTKRAVWDCVCKCGKHIEATTNDLEYGRTKSCGCKKSFEAAKRIKNEEGKTYGNLKVKQLLTERTKEGRTQYLCECLICGKECVVTGKALRLGTTKSCGCSKIQNRKSFGERTFKDLTGKIIGFLLVEGRAENSYSKAGNQATMWNCKCLLCGNHTVVAGTSLITKNHTRSCGCLKMSYNEKMVYDELIKLGVEFIHDHTFPDLISPRSYNPLRLDFALFKNGYLLAVIECQGIQHYQKFKNGFGDFQREVTDPMKKEYCKRWGIPLYEIKYDSDVLKELYKILSIVYNTSYDNTVPSRDIAM